MPPGSGVDGVHAAVTFPHAYFGIGCMIGVEGVALAVEANASEARAAPMTVMRGRMLMANRDPPPGFDTSDLSHGFVVDNVNVSVLL